MRKSVTKRVKITKNGKMLHRRSGSNHFNAKESRKSQHRKQSSVAFAGITERKMRQFMMQ